MTTNIHSSYEIKLKNKLKNEKTNIKQLVVIAKIIIIYKAIIAFSKIKKISRVTKVLTKRFFFF